MHYRHKQRTKKRMRRTKLSRKRAKIWANEFAKDALDMIFCRARRKAILEKYFNRPISIRYVRFI